VNRVASRRDATKNVPLSPAAGVNRSVNNAARCFAMARHELAGSMLRPGTATAIMSVYCNSLLATANFAREAYSEACHAGFMLRQLLAANPVRNSVQRAIGQAMALS
jgi:hypothetical protein